MSKFFETLEFNFVKLALLMLLVILEEQGKRVSRFMRVFMHVFLVSLFIMSPFYFQECLSLYIKLYDHPIRESHKEIVHLCISRIQFMESQCN